MAAAKAAYCDEFIQRLPDGYQTSLGDNGSTLSGGERQRISMPARAFERTHLLFCLMRQQRPLTQNGFLIQRAIARLQFGVRRLYDLLINHCNWILTQIIVSRIMVEVG